MKTPRVLYICHNHPSFHPGGTEIFAHDLFGAMKRDHGVDAMFLGFLSFVLVADGLRGLC